MRTINSVKNPRWVDQEHTKIEVLVDFDELDEEFVEFTPHPDDPEPHSRYIYEQVMAGAYGEISAWVPPELPSADTALKQMREQRSTLLERTDFVENPTYWARMTEEKQAEWVAYRNALRDLPENYPNVQFGFADAANNDYSVVLVNVEWPTKPE